MPIDENPIDALRNQFKMEDLSSSPVTKIVARIAGEVLPEPFKRAVQMLGSHLEKQSAERIYLLLETVADETVKYGKELDR